MTNYITYLHLLTPLHTGGSMQEGNLMGIAREVHTEFPYLPSSSLRGKIRSELDIVCPDEVNSFFGQKIQGGQQPTEGEIWFADATLIFFPIASLSHHLVWISCPLWLERWNRWIASSPLTALLKQCRESLNGTKSALISFQPSQLYLQTASLKSTDLEQIQLPSHPDIQTLLNSDSLIGQIANKLVILSDEDCLALVETGLQREVRVALQETSKTVKDGSFRSEEAIPPEAVLFFPWGIKPPKDPQKNQKIRQEIPTILQDKLQFAGLEGLGRGWCNLTTTQIK